jgi:hypothetical protein
VPADRGDDGATADGSDDGAAADPRAGLPADERALLEAFDRLAPQDSLRWNFDDTVRRLDEAPGPRSGLPTWGGLPADLWERGRSTRASERVLGDVITIVVQELVAHTDRVVAESNRADDEALLELRRTTFEAVRFLSARIDRLEQAAHPLGMPVGEFDLPVPDTTPWVGPVTDRLGGDGDRPLVVGELGDLGLLRSLVGSGATVDAVDPHGPVAWTAEGELAGSGGRATVHLDEVADHLRSLAPASRRAVVLSGCVDRASLAGKVELVDEAVRVVGPGGTLVLLVADQGSWAAGLDPVTADLLPGRPLHPETWRVVLAHRGAAETEWLAPGPGPVHAVVAEVGG